MDCVGNGTCSIINRLTRRNSRMDTTPLIIGAATQDIPKTGKKALSFTQRTSVANGRAVRTLVLTDFDQGAPRNTIDTMGHQRESYGSAYNTVSTGHW